MNLRRSNDRHLLTVTDNPRSSTLNRVGNWWVAIIRAGVQRLAHARRKRLERRELLSLTERDLHDIGLTYHDVERITGPRPRRVCYSSWTDPVNGFDQFTRTAEREETP